MNHLKWGEFKDLLDIKNGSVETISGQFYATVYQLLAAQRRPVGYNTLKSRMNIRLRLFDFFLIWFFKGYILLLNGVRLFKVQLYFWNTKYILLNFVIINARGTFIQVDTFMPDLRVLWERVSFLTSTELAKRPPLTSRSLYHIHDI